MNASATPSSTRRATPTACRSSQSWQLAHLTPRDLPWQTVLAHELAIEPAPDERREARDAFGNGVTHFGVHGAASAAARAHVVRGRGRATGPIRAAPSAPAAGRRCATRSSTSPRRTSCTPSRMGEPTALVPWSDAARAYAAPSFAAGRDWLEAVTDLMHRIHADFEFDAGATTVTTSVDEVLEQRGGVCQDFAHVMLACLRGHGLPARYVSGYLLHRSAAGAAAPARRRRVACLGGGLFAAARLGRVRPDQRHTRRPALHHARAGAATSPTSCRCAA